MKIYNSMILYMELTRMSILKTMHMCIIFKNIHIRYTKEGSLFIIDIKK